MLRSPYRGRFAPSPTGPLHFGSLVAAVASYLEARTHDGTWVVRIEDIDAPRVAPGATEHILRTLAACGMRWDGAVTYQSARMSAYHSALHRLQAMRRLYACACSRREVADSALNGIEGPVYPGTCRKRAPSKGARGLRLDTREAKISFVDLLQGRIEQDIEREVGDFVVYRPGRMYAYQLAVVIDDAEQGMTDVVRGADLLDSTARQIYIQQLLRLPTPRYCHVPVVTDASGRKLSKQTGAPAIDAQRPLSALRAALGFLGHEAPLPSRGSQSLDELWDWALREWRIERVPRLRQRITPAINAG